MRIHRRALLAAAAASVTAWPRAARGGERLAAGTRFETPVFRVESGRPGPTVAIVAGIHGNETAPPVAAELLTRAMLSRGRLWIVPEANRPGLAATSRFVPRARFPNVNRNFPTPQRPSPRGDMAPELWSALLAERPRWVLDLHEGWGYSASSKSMGSSVVCAGKTTVEADCLAMAKTVLDAVNAVVVDPAKRFTLLRPGPAGSLARSACEHGIRALVFETTWVQSEALRVAQQLLMVRAVLVALGMV